GLHRGEGVNVQMQDFLLDLLQKRVVELEETELHLVLALLEFFAHGLTGMGLLQILQDFARPKNQGLWHARHFCHMDPKTVLAASWDQLSQKEYPVLEFLYRYRIVLDPGEV